MSEIKFRAYFVDNLTMMMRSLPVSSIHLKKHACRTSCGKILSKSDGLILVQYTGLKDKNGTEIYEGDIALINGLIYRIEYIDEYLTWCPFTEQEWEWYKDGSNHFKYCYEESLQGEGSSIYFLSQLESNEIEIIGNIHEDLELLK